MIGGMLQMTNFYPHLFSLQQHIIALFYLVIHNFIWNMEPVISIQLSVGTAHWQKYCPSPDNDHMQEFTNKQHELSRLGVRIFFCLWHMCFTNYQKPKFLS